MKIEKICLDLAWLRDIKEFGSFEVPVGGEIVITVAGTQHGLFGFQDRNYETQYSPYDMAMRGGPGHSTDHSTIIIFWSIVSTDQTRLLTTLVLYYVTTCPRS